MEEFIVDLGTNWYKLEKTYRVCLYMCLGELMRKQENPLTITPIPTYELKNDQILLAKIVYFLHSATDDTKNKLYSIYYDDYKTTIKCNE